ncbi:hypothetical protein ACFL0T_01170 [Candidatus Omnitrophota bacterium]
MRKKRLKMAQEKINRDKSEKRKGRIVAFLNREEIDFIDKLSKDALFSTGHKLSRTDIIRALVNAIKAGDIDAEGVRSKQDLEKKLLILMHITLPQTAYDLKKKKEHGTI